MYSGLFVSIFFSCSLAWNEGSIVTFSYMNVDIFNQVYPTVLFCPSYSEKTGSSFQMIFLYSHVFFLHGPIALMRIAHSDVYERSFTGAWETFQWLYYWKFSLLPSTAIINCLGDHPSSMMECWWAQSCTGLMQAGMVVILLNSQHLWLFVHIWFIKIDHVDKKSHYWRFINAEPSAVTVTASYLIKHRVQDLVDITVKRQSTLW